MRDIDDEDQRFDAFFRAHHAAVRAYARRRVSGQTIDDVVSQTFIVAWRRPERVPADPLPWLLGVARNVIKTELRGETRRARLLAKAQSRHRETHDEIRVDAETHGPAVAALARLNEQDREVLGLVAWEGLTPTQAAEVLGIPPARFRVRLHRARRRLRWAMDAETGAGFDPAANDDAILTNSTRAIA
jgi:RNA polymerase sigma-70 factor, ECF subfamily